LAAPLLALALLAPVFLTFVRLDEPGLAAMLAMGGLAGAAGAVTGSVLEEGATAELLSALSLAPYLGREPAALAGGGAFEPGQGVLVRAACFGVALALARPTRGLAPLLIALLAVQAGAFGAAELAHRAVLAGENALLATLVAWPPPAAAELAAWVLCGSALAAGAVSRGSGRWMQLLGGLGLELAALVAWGFAAEPWGRWAAHTLGLSAHTG
jgi:hypothetical protein